MKNFPKVLFSISLVLILVLATSEVNAQEARSSQANQAVSPDATQSEAAVCSDFISETKLSMEKAANKDCKTQKRTISCQDSKSGMDVHVTMVVQPTNKGGCPNMVFIAEERRAEPLSRGAAADFKVEVLQEACPDGTTSLTAYVPGDDGVAKKNPYAYNWFSGDRLISTERTVECAPKDADIKLKVMKTSTGQFVKRTISSDGEAASNKDRKPYKVAAYEKTACYGTCPVYKVVFYSDGTATWNGIANTEKMGEWKTRYDIRTKELIKKSCFDNKYFDLYNKYPLEGEIADASRTITYVRVGDMEKSITHTTGGPESLVNFENTLLKIIDKLEWERAPKN